jgi:hypothetical protein
MASWQLATFTGAPTGSWLGTKQELRKVGLGTRSGSPWCLEFGKPKEELRTPPPPILIPNCGFRLCEGRGSAVDPTPSPPSAR